MPILLDVDRVFLNQDYASKQDAIRAIGEAMVSRGDVSERYVRGMLEKEEQFSTWVTEGVALPHGTNAVKSEIVRSSVIVVQAPKGIDWGDGKAVYLAIGLAGKGDREHLKLLSSLAAVLQHKEKVETLKTTQDPSLVVRILTGAE